MPLHRLALAQRLYKAGWRRFSKPSFNVKPGQLMRWQSTQGTPKTGRRGVQVVVYGLTATGLAMGATLAYANYDPRFKEDVGVYIPGFAALADFAADKWVDLVDYVNPKQNASVGLKTEKERVKMFESLKPKGDPAVKAEDEGVAKQPEDPKTALKPDVEASQQSSQTGELTAKDVSGGGSKVDRTAEKQIIRTTPEVKQEMAAKPEVKEPEIVPDIQPETAPDIQPETAPDIQPEVIPHPPVDLPPETEEKERVSSAVEGQEPERPTEGAAATTTSVEEPAGGKTAIEPQISASSVESVVASVTEKTLRAAQETMPEHIREHLAAQGSEENQQWLKVSAEVEAKLQEAYETFTKLSEKVLGAQKVLAQSTRDHQQRVKEALHAPVEDEGKVDSVVEGIASAGSAVEEAKKELEVLTAERSQASDVLHSCLEQAMELGLRAKVEGIKEKVSQFVTEVLAGAAAVAEAEAEGKVLEEYREEARRSREQLQRELGTELPEAESQQEALVLLLQKRVGLLKEKLERAEGEYQQKLVEALEKQKQSLERLAEDQLKWKLQKQEHQFQREAQRKVDELGWQYEVDLKEQFRTQADAHTQHLTEALQTQAKQLGEMWASELEQKLTEQEGHYQGELLRALVRLRGIENMVDTVADAGEATQRQQSLRTACDTLSTALQQANANPDPSARYRFTSEVTAVREAAHNDHFILGMLDSIPAEATGGGGIQSEAGLKERFNRVKKICKRVALVPETGAGLGTYALSYLQSLLTLNVWGTNAEDANATPQDMDTFELLHRAELHLHCGDLEEALVYLNHLQGESRRVARDWLSDARLHLETRQAVSMVLQYIAATSISIVH